MEHAVLVMLIAAGIGAGWKLDETELENLMVAATLHDIGELYMAPDTCRPGTPGSMEEDHRTHGNWRDGAAGDHSLKVRRSRHRRTP